MIGHTCFGHGPEHVIVLSGLPGNHSFFDAMLPGIDQEMFSYAFLDYRGFGLSRDIPGHHTLAELAGDADDLARSLGWDRFHVIGHSFGALVAQRLALDHQARVESVVAVTPIPASGNPLDAETKSVLLGALDNDEVLLAAAQAFAAGRLPLAWCRWLLRHTRETCEDKALNAYFRLSCETDFSAEISGLKTPFLVLAGADDPFYTRALMDNTFRRWLPDLGIETLPNCGHFPMLETPLLLAASVERFLKSRHPEQQGKFP